ncbi:MAG: DIP1984 family protein [Holophaga sp.]|nr:DIP1984 family protein [Holophaga sp.]
MQLAEALVQRKALKERIQQLQEAIEVAAINNEGANPDKDLRVLEGDLDRVRQKFEAIVVRIHRTNLAAQLPNGQSITAAIARRDTPAAKHRFAKSLLDLVFNRNKREGWNPDKTRQAAFLTLP